ncbi:MAG: hypothetical protein IKK20_04315, partial [Clostridia bacterium]|nr:hypothetical protein [Clostridia bacterium]
MKKSRVLTLGLACFLTAVTGLSTLAATSGGGALYSHLNDTSRNETASSQKFSQTTPQNANNAQNGLITPQDNDPVVFTTDYGLEIKYANALTYLTGYTYFTAGGVNWVIIGYDSSMADFVGDFSGETALNADPVQGYNNQFSTLDNTPAGLAIAKEMLAISSLAKPNEEIGDGCVLCLAEKHVNPDGVQFNTSTSLGNNYKGS